MEDTKTVPRLQSSVVYIESCINMAYRPNAHLLLIFQAIIIYKHLQI